ncbi:MAG: hypothetical protein ABIQ26_09685, partial [Streptosporangiaceae bacterium]
MSTLEARYRRLLRWYPAHHRHAHEDEMLGVLLADAGPGQERPHPRDTFDLVRGGLWIRLRHLPEEFRRPEWRDAAGIVSLILSLLMLGLSIRYLLKAADNTVALVGTAPFQRLPLLAFGNSKLDLFATAPYWIALGTGSGLALAGL